MNKLRRATLARAAADVQKAIGVLSAGVDAQTSATLTGATTPERIRDLLGEVKGIIEECRDDESSYFDAMPDSFKEGEKGQNAEAAVAALDNAIDHLDSAIEAASGTALSEDNYAVIEDEAQRAIEELEEAEGY